MVDSNNACINVTVKGDAFARRNQRYLHFGIGNYLLGTTDYVKTAPGGNIEVHTEMEKFLGIEYSGATAGLIVVTDGTVDPKNVKIPVTGGGDKPSETAKSGIHINTIKTLANALDVNDPDHTAVDGTRNGKERKSIRELGLNIYSVFMDPNAHFPLIDNLQPRIFCQTVVPGILEIPDDKNLAAFNAKVPDFLAKTLADGHKSTCRIGDASDKHLKTFRNKADLESWVDAAKDKNELKLLIVGVKTEAKTLNQILPGADADARIASLVGGITPANLTAVKDTLQSVRLTIKVAKTP